MRLSELASGELSSVEAFMDAAIEGGARTEGLPWILAYAPVASMNPFQRILYSRAGQHGFSVVPAMTLANAGLVSWKGRSVIHLHWLASVLKDSASRRETDRRLRDFDAKLAAWAAAGHRLVWTLHNILPHDHADRDAEIRLREILAERVDLIHVLSKASVVEAKSVFRFDEAKVFHVPHPSYEGWYANLGDRQAARLDLGVAPDAFMFLQFGSLQPYKGTLELISSFNELVGSCAGRRLQLVIAGKPVDADYAAAVQKAAAGNSRIKVILSSMEEREVQTLFNAADAAVAPYTRTLNSGVALLASTFDKPLIAPARGGILETYGEASALLYEPLSAGALLDAMRRSLDNPVDPSGIARIRERHAPARVSDEFFAQLTQRFHVGK